MKLLQARDNEIGTLKSARRHFSRTRCHPSPAIHPNLLPFDWEREQPSLRERAERTQPTRYASLRPTMRRSRSLRQSRPTRLTPIGAWHHVMGQMLSMALARSVYNHAPDALAFMHQVEPL